VYASSVGIPSSANVIRGSFFLSSSSFFRSSFSFLMASLSSFLLFFSRVLGERAVVVALSSLFLFFLLPWLLQPSLPPHLFMLPQQSALLTMLDLR
jgi:hypothetical protein